MKETLTVIAVLLAVAGNIPYLIDVIRHRVEPHAYTWFVWSIVSSVTFFGMLAKGGGIAATPVGASEIFTIIIFFSSLHNGFKHITRTDTVFLVVALIGLIPWALTKDPTISVIIVVAIDVIAFMPTLRKTWKHPDTETPLLYGSNVLRHILILATVGSYNIATTLHSIAMIITNTSMTLFISLKGRKRGLLN